MATSKNSTPDHSIHLYLQYLQTLVEQRLQHYFSNALDPFDLHTVLLPAENSSSPFTSFIKKNALQTPEIIALLIALAPHVNPVFFDQLIQQHLPDKGDFPQLGGVRGKNHRGFLPTGETVIFILAGVDLKQRLQYQVMFDHKSKLSRLNVVWLEDVPTGEPKMSGKLILSAEHLELFTVGKVSYPKLSLDFPAQHLTTEMLWNDVVLNETTRQQINDLETWVTHNDTLMGKWGMRKKIKPGYRVLFYGPPGTGKTLTATLLGKYTGKDVFRIDLSMVVSKFIGETEKNLSQLFSRAENKNWILFFDEADALFSKRTNVRDAHDKYANQEAAYLLQRIENFGGLVILASNFRNNIDDAFVRRFHSIIHFPPPTTEERLKIWEKAFPKNSTLDSSVDLTALAKKYELTGSSIMSAVHYTCLLALAGKTNIISWQMILSGVQKEYIKEGKMW